MNQIGILGNGGQANELESYIRGSVSFRAVDSGYVSEGLVDISSPTSDQKNTQVIAAIGAPGLRKNVIERWKGSKYSKVIAVPSSVDESLKLGDGSFIAPGSVITTNVTIGEHTLINTGVTISHDVNIGDFATISPGANIAGNVTIGRGVFIGIGAVVSNGLHIADGVVIGAGAVVLKDIDEENSVHAGVPAKKIGQNEAWLHEI